RSAPATFLSALGGVETLDKKVLGRAFVPRFLSALGGVETRVLVHTPYPKETLVPLPEALPEAPQKQR
ncbi:MAG: hypothetical protein ABDH91_09175, partial [Bacteroidia bacterium]